jgi:hypothetical protein
VSRLGFKVKKNPSWPVRPQLSLCESERPEEKAVPKIARQGPAGETKNEVKSRQQHEHSSLKGEFT